MQRHAFSRQRTPAVPTRPHVRALGQPPVLGLCWDPALHDGWLQSLRNVEVEMLRMQQDQGVLERVAVRLCRQTLTATALLAFLLREDSEKQVSTVSDQLSYPEV